ncbi:MAG TPA: YkvA family protein [Gemmatimonadota bacterium]|nr:YkvA family protein [Gemmatimonadota bacterium]
MSARELRPLGEAAADGQAASSARDTLKEIALFLPNFVILLKRLISDPRVPRKSKLVLCGTVLYLVSPIDVVPDFVPGLGQLDDAVVALLALHSILNRVDDEVIVEHWPGDENVIRMVRAGLSAVAQLLPGKWESRV